MKISIVIPTLNEEKNIGLLLDSIANQTYKDVEIIVVDDGSTDKTKEICLQKNIKFLQNNPARRGPAFGRNKGAMAAQGEIVCFLDADSILDDRDFFKNAVKLIGESTAAVWTSYKTAQSNWLEKAVTQKSGITMEPKFIRKNVFLELDGFPEIGFGEDQVLVKKLENYLVQRKLEKVTALDAVVSGHGVLTFGEMYKQAKWYGKTAFSFIREYSKYSTFKETALKAFATFLRPLYFVSFVFLLLSAGFPVFFPLGIPFIAIFFAILIKSAVETVQSGNNYRVFRVFLFLAFGAGMVHGICIRILGINKKMGH